MERNDKVRGGKVSDGKKASKRKKKEEKKVVRGRRGAQLSVLQVWMLPKAFKIFFFFFFRLFVPQAGRSLLCSIKLHTTLGS